MTETKVPVVAQQPQAPDIRVLSGVVQELRRPDRVEQLRSLLGSDAAVERFVTVSLQSITGNRDLLTKVTPASLIDAIREAAALDLEPTGILGEAWIVRHGDRAVLRVGWRGFLKMIRRDPEMNIVDCQLVYQEDEFNVELGTSPYIKHVPSLYQDRGNYLGAYAWARTRRGELYIEWMSTSDIEEVKRRSQSGDKGPWKDWWGEMARKSVVRRLAKRLPLHAIAQAVVEVDEKADEAEFNADVRAARRKTLELLAGTTEAEKSDEELIKEALEKAEGDVAAEPEQQGESGDSVSGAPA